MMSFICIAFGFWYSLVLLLVQQYVTERSKHNKKFFFRIADQHGALWISSNRGLTRFDPDSGKTRQFDNRNGLRDSEFHQGARLRSRSGRLLFGGATGLVGFFPGELPINDHPPGVVITASSRQEKLASVASGEQPPLIEVSYLDRFLAFDFVGLDFMSPTRTSTVTGCSASDNDWIDGDSFRRAIYTNLPPGQFSFQVQSANNDGLWNSEGAAISVLVIPPPWNTWWAYLSYILIAASIVGLYLTGQRAKLQREARQRALLEEEVDARTRELAQRNNDLESLNEKLAEASVTDSLTGLRNRRYVDQFISSEIALFERNRSEEQGRRVVRRKGNFMAIAVLLDPLDGPYFEESIYVTPSCHHPEVLAEVARETQLAIETIGLTAGPVHAELRIDGSFVRLIELAARPIGGLCGEALQFGLLGTSLETMLLRGALGMRIPAIRPYRPASAS